MSDTAYPDPSPPKDYITRKSLLEDLAEKKKQADSFRITRKSLLEDLAVKKKHLDSFRDLCRDRWWSLSDASSEVRGNKEIILEAVQKDWRALQYASNALKANKEVVLAAVRHASKAILFACNSLKGDKQVVLECVQQDGNCLRFASDELRADKECVLAAVSNQPEALKFALEGLHQDRDCLIAAGLWDQGYEARASSMVGTTKVVLSTKFSLHEDSTPTATQFTVLLKAHPCFKKNHHQGGDNKKPCNNFVVYSPNAFQKGTCDPEWTRMEWPCRGTLETCRMPLEKSPNQPICWRVSFRHHLEEARDTMGFMVQIVELRHQGTHTSYEYQHQLGKGQEIERVMAREVGVKVFVAYQSLHPCFRHRLQFEREDIDRLCQRIQEWYDSGGTDREVCHVGEHILGT